MLWLYIWDECDHAGIWNIELDVFKMRVGISVSLQEVLTQFNGMVVPFDNNSRLFIPDFVEFQYGELNPENRAHASVIRVLREQRLLNDKGLIRGLYAPMDKDKDKDKDKEPPKFLKEEPNLFPLDTPPIKKEGRPKSEDDVVAYLTQEGYESPQENANKFFNFYQSKGWKVGKNAMVDWKSAVKTWRFTKTGATPTPQHPYTEEQVRQIKRRLERDGDGSYPEWFDLKYKPILNYFTLVGASIRRGEE